MSDAGAVPSLTVADPMQVIQRALADAQRGRVKPAIAALERLVQKKGAPAEAHHFLGMLLFREGRPEPAIFHLDRAVRLAPGRAQFESNFANVLASAGRLEEAIARYRAAIEADGAYGPARVGLAGALLHRGEIAEAEEEARRGLALSPASADAAANLSSCLIVTGRAGEAAALLREAIERLGASIQLNTLLAAALNYDAAATAAQVLDAHRTLGALHAQAAKEWSGSLPPLKAPERQPRPLRVGYLSADFRDHPVAMFIEPALESDETAEVYCYDVTERPDEASERLRQRRVVWRDARGANDAELAAMVRRDEIDVLIELSGHSLGHRQTALAARTAPVQVSMLGYPATTGNPAMDARIVDERSDPPGSEQAVTERLVRLDPCAWCFSEPRGAPEVGPLPAGHAGPVTFGSFNNLAKAVPAVLDAWAALLADVPRARLALKNGAFTDARVRERVAAELEGRGVARGRLELLAPAADAAGHLNAYRGIDIALDTFPYAGTTTTCEAMWMGVPVVTLRGSVHAGRVGVSLLKSVGLDDLVADDTAAYVRIAAGLAADRARLAALRSTLRERMRSSPLMDRGAYRARLHEAYAAMVRERAGGAT